MKYNLDLAERVRVALRGARPVDERKMFGGITFMVGKKMCVSVGKNRIMCRIDPAFHDNALRRKGCRSVVMKGRPYRGFVYVDAKAVQTQADLDYWVGLALDYNSRARPRFEEAAVGLWGLSRCPHLQGNYNSQISGRRDSPQTS